jgi:hypothetical protein
MGIMQLDLTSDLLHFGLLDLERVLMLHKDAIYSNVVRVVISCVTLQ